jgi:hypothetical protein
MTRQGSSSERPPRVTREAGPSRGSILPPALHDRARVRVHPSQDDHARSRVPKASALCNPTSPLHGNVNERRQTRRPVSRDVEGSDPARRRIQTDGRHLTFVTRISPFAGRVTEASLRGNTKLPAERVELRPAATRMNVFRRSCEYGAATTGCPGDGKPGLTVLHDSRKRTCQRASSTRSLPNHVTTRTSQGARARHAARNPNLGHRSRPDAPPGGDEGAIGLDALHRSAALGTKASSGSAIRTTIFVVRAVWRQTHESRCEDSRVRECDLITCCVASPPRCPSDRHRPQGNHTRKRGVETKRFTRLPSRSAA